METQVEELPENRVRLRVDVPSADVKHAVDHAASDLATSLRIPGFRKGKVPMPVLLARVGRDRLYAEAVESHIGGWFWSAASKSRIQPVTPPEYGYELPTSANESFSFTATVDVQPRPDVADWTELEVPRAEPEVPSELVDGELESLRHGVAELSPVDGRRSEAGDVAIVDLRTDSGETQRDVVAELGGGRLIEEIDEALTGMARGETQEIEYAGPDGEPRKVTATLSQMYEKVLPPVDDELARAASEFDTLEALRSDMEADLREQLEFEIDGAFRTAAVDRLVEASRVEASGPLVARRTAELARGLERSLGARGITLDTYLTITDSTADSLRERLSEQARQSVARELVLAEVADRLGIQVADEELEAFVREQAAATGDDPEATLAQVREAGQLEALREDLRLRMALDRVAAEVRPIAVELAQARDKLWTPGQETAPGDTKLWTPASKEPA